MLSASMVMAAVGVQWLLFVRCLPHSNVLDLCVRGVEVGFKLLWRTLRDVVSSMKLLSPGKLPITALRFRLSSESFLPRSVFWVQVRFGVGVGRGQCSRILAVGTGNESKGQAVFWLW